MNAFQHYMRSRNQAFGKFRDQVCAVFSFPLTRLQVNFDYCYSVFFLDEVLDITYAF